MLDGFDDRSAFAMCTFAFATSADDPVLFCGKTEVYYLIMKRKKERKGNN